MAEAKRNDGEVPGQPTLPHPGVQQYRPFSAPHRRDAKRADTAFLCIPILGEICECQSIAGPLWVARLSRLLISEQMVSCVKCRCFS